MLRNTLKFGRPLYSASKFQNNVFNRNVIAGANLTAQKQIIPTQYRSETTDLSMALQFPIQPEKLKNLINRIDQLGGTLQEKTLVNEVYYDSVPNSEVIEAEVELASGRADVVTEKGQEAKREKGDADRAKPAPRVKTQKKDNAADYVLTKRDMWLLRQNGQWMLRIPAVDETGRTHLALDISRRIPIYRVAEGERAIRRELSLQQDETSEARTGVPLPTLEADLAARMGVVPFAAFKTTQYLLTVPSGEDFEIGKDMDDEKNDDAKVTGSSGDELHKEDPEVGDMLSLEIEETDFGYAMGKLSILIENPDEEGIEDKLDSVASVLEALDVQLVDRTNSTILEYLERHRSNHFKQLVTASVAKNHEEKQKKKKEEESKEE